MKSDFIEKQKLLYKSLKPVFCHALLKTVHFNAEGLRHLLFDNKNRPRNHSERVYRMALIDHIQKVIKNSNKFSQKNFIGKEPTIIFVSDWVNVYHNKKNIDVKVILRKIGNGNIHFLSVMRKKTKKSVT